MNLSWVRILKRCPTPFSTIKFQFCGNRVAKAKVSSLWSLWPPGFRTWTTGLNSWRTGMIREPLQSTGSLDSSSHRLSWRERCRTMHVNVLSLLISSATDSRLSTTWRGRRWSSDLKPDVSSMDSTWKGVAGMPYHTRSKIQSQNVSTLRCPWWLSYQRKTVWFPRLVSMSAQCTRCSHVRELFRPRVILRISCSTSNCLPLTTKISGFGPVLPLSCLSNTEQTRKTQQKAYLYAKPKVEKLQNKVQMLET